MAEDGRLQPITGHFKDSAFLLAVLRYMLKKRGLKRHGIQGASVALQRCRNVRFVYPGLNCLCAANKTVTLHTPVRPVLPLPRQQRTMPVLNKHRGQRGQNALLPGRMCQKAVPPPKVLSGDNLSIVAHGPTQAARLLARGHICLFVKFIMTVLSHVQTMCSTFSL